MIPLSRPSIGAEEEALILEVLKSGRLSLGKFLPRFEESFRNYLGTDHAVAVANGTSALAIILKGLSIGKGDEVITSPYSFIASANAIVLAGARPVFLDVEEDTLNMDPARIEDAITAKTKALLVVHLYGHPCDMDPIMDIAERHHLPVIEDSCEALGASYRGKKAGTFGRASAFGFYANKQITTAEGGMIVTRDAKLAQFAQRFRNQGRDASSSWLEHPAIGANYRLSELHSALGVAQMQRLHGLLEARRAVAEAYDMRLSACKQLRLPVCHDMVEHAWFLYPVRLAVPLDRNGVIAHMRHQGVMTRAYFPAIHLMPFYRDTYGFQPGDFPITEKAAGSVLCLPFYPGLTNAQIDQTAAALLQACALRP